jgi:F-type H+-transporting ATPase subunit b
MISINATLVVQVIQFLILVFILNRLMFRPILRLINKRKEFIDQTKNEIEKIILDTKRVRDEYVMREAHARRDAAKERVRIRDEGIASAEEFLDSSRNEVTSIRTEADNAAEEQINETRPFLQGEAEVLAEEIMERVIGRRIAG